MGNATCPNNKKMVQKLKLKELRKIPHTMSPKKKVCNLYNWYEQLTEKKMPMRQFEKKDHLQGPRVRDGYHFHTCFLKGSEFGETDLTKATWKYILITSALEMSDIFTT